jgi:ATP-dependent Lon protease
MPKPRFIPMFPLKIVVFPSERLNLHIFEPRYKQLMMDCEKGNLTFGIVAFIDNRLMEVGTELRLLKIEKIYEDGKMDVITEGVGLFKVVDFYSQAIGKMYGAADVLDIEIKESEGDYLKNEQILELATELFRLLKIQKKLPLQASLVKTHHLAHFVGFTIEQEYEFLCIDTEEARQNYMIEHINRILPVVKEMEFLKERALLNGHFKNIIPPKF